MDYRKEYEKWLASPALSEDERAELRALEGNDKEIKARFYGPLEFGTAGLRGTMYTGLHNMNRHVIRWATQGFANVIRAEGEEAMQKGVAVCMDCRNHSAEFARETACVMAANGIHVRLFESLRPTPELSFAVREYGCQAGVNVTASHNPKEYNGYKVYWADGAQLPPQHAAAIADELTRIDIFTGVRSMDYEQALAEGRIELLGEDCDRRFMANVMGMVNDYETVKKVADDFGLVYTPFHGCGYKLVPEALTRLGIKHLYCEPKQMVIDGDFPTVVSPNPENPEGFYLAIDLAKEKICTKEEALTKIDARSLDQLLHPTFVEEALKNSKPIATGNPASPGSAVGHLSFTSEDAKARHDQGEKVILVRAETAPEDLEGMVSSEGVLTMRGGMTSHAAVVARGMGRCAVTGCGAAQVDEKNKTLTINGKVYGEKDTISLDGSTGAVYEGSIPTEEAKLSGDFATIMKWSDAVRKGKMSV